MNILLSFNTKFVPVVRPLLISLMCHHESLHFYVAYLDLDQESQDSLRELVEDLSYPRPWDSGAYAKKSIDRHITFIKCDANLVDNLRHSSRWSAETWCRCFVWDQIDVDRLLYLDCDIVVDGNIERYYRDDMRGLPLKASPDLDVFQLANREESLRELQLNDNPEMPYFCAGVLLFDLNNMRSQGITVADMKKAVEKLPPLQYLDQDFLNVYFRNNYKPADPYLYNLMVPIVARYQQDRLPRYEQIRFCESETVDGRTKDICQNGAFYDPSRPLIVHFCSRTKPFKALYRYGYTDTYWKYALLDPLETGEHKLLRRWQKIWARIRGPW